MDEPFGAALRMEDHAFALGLLEFFAALRGAHHGHLVEGFEADHVDFGRASADGGARHVERRLHFAGVGVLIVTIGAGFFQSRAQSHPRGVESDEAAADDQNLLAEIDAITVVDVDQVINGLDHAVKLRALNLQVAPFLHPDAQEDRLVAFVAQLLQAELCRERRVVSNLNAELFDLGDFLVDDRARQSEFGDAVKHHSARLIGRLEDSHPITHQRQVVRASQPGGAGADDGHPPPSRYVLATRLQDRQIAANLVALIRNAIEQLVLRVGRDRFDAVALGHESFQGADADGLIDLSAAAAVFAGSGADAPADRSQWVRRARDEIGVFVTPLRDQLHVAPGVGVDRACRLTGNHAFPEFDIGNDRLVLEVTHSFRPFERSARIAKTEPQLRNGRRPGLTRTVRVNLAPCYSTRYDSSHHLCDLCFEEMTAKRAAQWWGIIRGGCEDLRSR